MNLRHIEVFHAVYTNGSAVAAAQALNVSQPSISKVLRHAEARLGFLLFNRVKGRLVPTDEAHALFREVDAIFAQVLALRRKAHNIGHDVEHQIRVATLPTFGLDLLPQAVAHFRATHKRVHFDLQTLHTDGFLSALQDRACDIAIGCEAPRHPQLTCQEIGASELVLLHRPGALPEAESVGLDILERLDFINAAADSGPLARLFFQEVNRRDLDLRPIVTVNTMYVAASLAAIGTGVTVVDRLTALAFQSRGLVHTRLDPALRFSIYCVHLADRPLSKITQSFIKQVRLLLQPDV